MAGAQESAMETEDRATQVIDLKPHIDVKRAKREAKIRAILPGFRSAPDRSMPVVPGYERAYDLTYWMLKAHPDLTPDELAEMLDGCY
jgi:hypothetical protein